MRTRLVENIVAICSLSEDLCHLHEPFRLGKKCKLEVKIPEKRTLGLRVDVHSCEAKSLRFSQILVGAFSRRSRSDPFLQ